MTMGFNNLSDMYSEVTSLRFVNLLILTSQNVEEDFVVSHKKAFKKKTKREKEGKDTEEKGGSFFVVG